MCLRTNKKYHKKKSLLKHALSKGFNFLYKINENMCCHYQIIYDFCSTSADTFLHVNNALFLNFQATYFPFLNKMMPIYLI